MGYQLLNFIAQQCQSLTASTAPTIDAIGLRIVLSLATIMLVWFGIQEALASAQGGQGFNMARFLNFFMLISFAYMFVLYYDSSIPGIGYSLKGFISDGTTDLANTIGHDATVSMLQSIDTSLQKSGPGMAMFTAPYMMVAYILNQISLAVLAALVSVIIAYGEIAAAIIGLLGPIFIPFLIIEKLEFLFWGWLRAFLSFSFYKVVAAAVTMQAWAQSPVPSPQESCAKRRSQMLVQETKSPEITRAAERYLEQYGDPLVMNTYLKITILVLGVVCLMLGALTFT